MLRDQLKSLHRKEGHSLAEEWETQSSNKSIPLISAIPRESRRRHHGQLWKQNSQTHRLFPLLPKVVISPSVRGPASFLSTDKVSKTWEQTCHVPSAWFCAVKRWTSCLTQVFRIRNVAQGEEAAHTGRFSPQSSQGPRTSQRVGAQKRVVF